MADRDRFGGSERDYLPVGKAAQRHEVNHQGYSPPWRDTRFGGNMERANTGIPYPTGGRDVRFEGSLPHKFSYLDNGRSVTSDVEPYWTDMGRNWSVPIPQSRTGTPNFRGRDMGSGAYLSNQFGRGDDGGGLGGLQEQAGLWQDIKRILKNTKNPGPLIDQWTEHWMKSQRMAGNDTGIGSTNEYQTAYNVGDTYPLEGKPGYGTRGQWTKHPSDLPELQTIPLDQQFDLWGNPIGGDDFGYFDEEFVGLG